MTNDIVLHIMVGVPGSGKSTYTKNARRKDDVVLSSDALRAELLGDENSQQDNQLIFETMQRRAIDALNDGKTVWYDATNINRKARKSIISVCPKHVKIVADIVWSPIARCIINDAQRSRTVGEGVIDKMLKRFEMPYFDEGIDEVKVHLPDYWDENTSRDYMRECLKQMEIPHDNHNHSLGVGGHCLRAMRLAEERGVGADIMRVMLAHDVGKPYTKAFKNAKGEPTEEAHYYSHQNVGAWIAIGFPLYSVSDCWLIGAHMEPYLNSKYYDHLPKYLKDKVRIVHEFDEGAH